MLDLLKQRLKNKILNPLKIRMQTLWPGGRLRPWVEQRVQMHEFGKKSFRHL